MALSLRREHGLTFYVACWSARLNAAQGETLKQAQLIEDQEYGLSRMGSAL